MDWFWLQVAVLWSFDLLEHLFQAVDRRLCSSLFLSVLTVCQLALFKGSSAFCDPSLRLSTYHFCCILYVRRKLVTQQRVQVLAFEERRIEDFVNLLLKPHVGQVHWGGKAVGEESEGCLLPRRLQRHGACPEHESSGKTGLWAHNLLHRKSILEVIRREAI